MKGMILGAIVLLLTCSCTVSEPKLLDSTVVKAGDSWSPLTSLVENGLIHCESGGNGYTFELHAFDGSFFVQQENEEPQFVSHLIIKGSGDAYWEHFIPSNPSLSWNGTQTFVEVLVRKEDRYVGYAVVKIEYLEHNARYFPTVVECKEVSPHFGRDIEVSQETLLKMMDVVIQKYK